MEFLNRLESTSLIMSFLNNPPDDFKIQNISIGNYKIPAFRAKFDILTTAVESAKQFADKLASSFLIDKLYKRFLIHDVLFIGTTVSEYALIPQSISPGLLSSSLLNTLGRSGLSHLIVKDLPYESPLLSEEENIYAKKFLDTLKNRGFSIFTGQALAYLPINFNSFNDYLMKFSSKRRNDLKRKIKGAKRIKTLEIYTGGEFFSDSIVEELYGLYENVYNKSYINFDKLSFEFFKNIFQNTDDGLVFVNFIDEQIIGFNLCYIHNNFLIDKYKGFLYPESFEYKLFFNQFFQNIQYCIDKKLKAYIMGWTAPEVKAYIGCNFTYTYHAVYTKNKLLKKLVELAKPLFESDKETLTKLNRSEKEDIEA